MFNFKSALLVTAICVLPFAAQAGDYNRDGYDRADYNHQPRHETGFFHSMKETFNPDERMDMRVRSMNVSETRKLQRALAARGFYKGQIDGMWGEQTAEAVRDYQDDMGVAETGVLTTTDLHNLDIRTGYYNHNRENMNDDMAATGDFRHTRTETTTRYIQKVDIVTHGNSGTARGARAFKE